MSNKVILFTNPDCAACLEQNEVLQAYAAKINKVISINEVNVNNYPNKFQFVEVTPTWAIQLNENNYFKYEGVINDDEDLGMIVKASASSFGSKRVNSKNRLIKKLKSKKKSRRSNFRFGNTKPLMENINNLAFYGKNFPNGQGFNIPNSF